MSDCFDCKHSGKEIYEEPCCECQNSFVEGSMPFLAAPLLYEPSETSNSTAVNHPAHYNQGGIECIDAMVAAYGKEAVENFCLINAFKYVWRNRDKNGFEDIDKAIWYLNKVKELNSSD